MILSKNICTLNLSPNPIHCWDTGLSPADWETRCSDACQLSPLSFDMTLDILAETTRCAKNAKYNETEELFF